MILLPIGHETMTVRRLPWVSISIAVACLLVHLGFVVSGALDMSGAQDDLRDAVMYWVERPYLQLDDEAAETMRAALGTQRFEALQAAAPPPLDAGEKAVRAEEQTTLVAMFQKVRDAIEQHPFQRVGFVPAHPTLLSLVAHMFLHGGWLHLLGNLFFLYLVGPFIEDAWGRPLYAALYIASGFAGALGFLARFPGLDVPMVGASGAIAGLMGAFLVRFWNTRIRFFYMFLFVVRGTFWAPAWLMLSLWLGQQFFWATLTDAAAEEGGGGVAYWAHIAGFIFGVGFAAVVRFIDLERRVLAPAIERKTTTAAPGNELIERAYALRTEGRAEDAFALLRDESARDPRNTNIGLAYWVFACDAERPAEAAAAMLEVVRQNLREGADELAVRHYAELDQLVPRHGAEPALLARIAGAMVERGLCTDAVRALRSAMRTVDATAPAGLLLRIARTAAPLDPPLAACAARLALRRHEATAEERTEAERVLASLPEVTAGAEPVG